MSNTVPRSAAGRLGPWVVLLMLAMVCSPIVVTLGTVHAPGVLQVNSANPTPYGYTWSLLMFIIPIIVVGAWLIPHTHVVVPRRAFWCTALSLSSIGGMLDFFLAHRFFVFPNRLATLQVNVPAVGAHVPIEEFFFYITGFVAILLIYIWLDEYWLYAYNIPDYKSASGSIVQLIGVHPHSTILALALISGSVAYKKLLSAAPDGLPEYFIFLVLCGLVPAIGFFPVARPFINWRALSLTLFIVLPICLVWEATLAIPYGWWGYQQSRMIGLKVDAWSGLPIEAIFVWIAVSYGAVIFYEIAKIWLYSDRMMGDIFFGRRPSP